jgi:hypothetical protein
MSDEQQNEEGDVLDPQAVREWILAERERLSDYLTAEGGLEYPNPQAEWWFAPYVIVWSIEGGWALSGNPPTDFVVDNDAIGSARDAARYFVRRFRDISRQLEAAQGESEDSQTLARWAEALMMSVRQDEDWPEEPSGNDTPAAGRAEELLKGALFQTTADPLLAPVLRIVHRRKPAPGGDHHGVYFYLDVSGPPEPAAFDALARRITEIDTQFAPLVAHRVQYAMVYFGINFGTGEKEIDAERRADEMRARNPDLSRRIDEYGLKGSDLIPIHLVDNSDQPFTAHPCLVREPDNPYTAEAEYFNCRDQEFHKQMESSSVAAMRLIAASIDPDVVAEARRAFAAR